MKCMHPLTIKVPIRDKLGIKIDEKYLDVPCGKCYNCVVTRRSEWTGRLMAEFECCQIAQFVTLTYDDNHLYYNEKGCASVNKDDIQKFLKRFRKRLESIDITLRYFLVADYGGSLGRPHYHALFFYYSEKHIHWSEVHKLDSKLSDLIALSWNNSVIPPVCGTLEQASCHYCTKYALKIVDVPPGSDDVFLLTSRNPGLGAGFIDKSFIRQHRKIKDSSGVCESVYINGNKYPMSRFFKSKIFTRKIDKLTYENYFQMLDKNCDENEKDRLEKLSIYMSKYPNNTYEQFVEHYGHDVSVDMIELLKYKQKQKHNIKK